VPLVVNFWHHDYSRRLHALQVFSMLVVISG
jgi:hypothetical protein